VPTILAESIATLGQAIPLAPAFIFANAFLHRHLPHAMPEGKAHH